MTKVRKYSELRHMHTFEERFKYLELRGAVGRSTFGYDRWINQRFYTSTEWRTLRNAVIVRDAGCDLGIPGREIHGRLLIHHMNPITLEDFKHGNDAILDLDNLIAVTHETHNAIHYGDISLVATYVERRPGDTLLWTRMYPHEPSG